MKIRTSLHFLILLIFILGGCAKQTTPTGGPKDTIPPLLVESQPRKNQVNFNGRSIELTFNELIALDNPKEKIIITPDIAKNFDVTAKKKKVFITFKEDLKDTVTYSINFQESIKDITEKNPAENLKLAFSTGNYIDSLTIKGNVVNPQTGKEIKNATVALYQSDTFSIFKHRPSYISKTNEKGVYMIENLKPGDYKLYAFDDANKNLTVDSRNESYAFLTDPITLRENIAAPELNIVKLDARPIKLTSARPYNTYFNIKFSKGIKRYKLKAALNDSLYSIIGDDNASIKLYNNFTVDSIAINITAWDSINQQIDTTLYAKFQTKKTTPEQFEVTSDKWSMISNKGKMEGKLKFNKPIASINFDSIYFQIDSLTKIPFSQKDVEINHITREILFKKTIDKTLLTKPTSPATNTPSVKTRNTKPTPQLNQQNKIYFGKSSLISIELDTAEIIAENVRPLSLEETGIININIQTTQPFYIVQLLDKNSQIIQSARNRATIHFEDLVPGEYQARLIIDKNNDGEWSPGNVQTNEPTEKIVFYKNEKKNSTISLKANWEIGPLLITY